MTVVKGRITIAIRQIEFAKKNEETTPTLTINRIPQEILENREKVKKE